MLELILKELKELKLNPKANINALFNLKNKNINLPNTTTIIPIHKLTYPNKFYSEKSLIMPYTQTQKSIGTNLNIDCNRVFYKKYDNGIISYKVEELKDFAKLLNLKMSNSNKEELVKAIREVVCK